MYSTINFAELQKHMAWLLVNRGWVVELNLSARNTDICVDCVNNQLK